MPQLDISTFPPQLIWLAITFIALYLIMSRSAVPRITQVMEERQKKIDDNLNLAESLKAETEAEAESYEKAMAEAREQARSAIHEATQEMSSESQRRHDELGEQLVADIKAAEQRIEEAKNAAISGIREAAVAVAAEATERLIGVEPGDEATTSAVETALKENA